VGGACPDDSRPAIRRRVLGLGPGTGPDASGAGWTAVVTRLPLAALRALPDATVRGAHPVLPPGAGIGIKEPWPARRYCRWAGGLIDNRHWPRTPRHQSQRREKQARLRIEGGRRVLTGVRKKSAVAAMCCRGRLCTLAGAGVPVGKDLNCSLVIVVKARQNPTLWQEFQTSLVGNYARTSSWRQARTAGAGTCVYRGWRTGSTRTATSVEWKLKA